MATKKRAVARATVPVAAKCAAGVCDPQRTEGLKAPAPNGTYALVNLKGPDVFLGAEISKQGGTNDLTFAGNGDLYPHFDSPAVDLGDPAHTSSATDLAGLAPCSASAATLSCDRLYAVTSWPDFSRFAAMPAPMFPSPMNPIFMPSTMPRVSVGRAGLGSGGAAKLED